MVSGAEVAAAVEDTRVFFDHAMPFNVQRGWNELDGIEHTRIPTAHPDRAARPQDLGLPATVSRGRTLDVVVVGAGIVGLATAMRLMERHPGLRLAVVDKESRIASHQTGRNSGVIHRGIYYAPGSLKARLCTAGATQLTAFCDERGIPYRRCGKVILAVDESELPALRELQRRGEGNGVPGLRWIGPDELREIEPHARAIAALHSPETAIVDFSAVAQAVAEKVTGRGGEVRLSCEVKAVARADGGFVVETTAGEIRTRNIISCAGLQSDRVAAMTGTEGRDDLRIVPFRGDYHVLRPERGYLCRGLIYPVPDPRFPFLGVHLTVRMDGSIWAGPNAVPAFAREGYRLTDVNLRDLAGTLRFRGFWRVAGRFWRTGLAEMWRDMSRPAFAAALRRHVPELRNDDLLPGPSGVRAQAIDRSGALVDDFVITGAENAIHVRNAPSPAATSSLAIASLIADRAEEAFDL